MKYYDIVPVALQFACEDLVLISKCTEKREIFLCNASEVCRQHLGEDEKAVSTVFPLTLAMEKHRSNK